jgi:hypothetical protein
MGSPSNYSIACDGCGHPASPEHIAERLARLELATRFRPVHIQVLFVALAPLARPEDDFYRHSLSRDHFGSLLDAVGIPTPAGEASAGPGQAKGDAARLAEFQRKGYFLSYVSECPLPEDSGNPNTAISALGPTFVRRVRFNYKPKHIALLGSSVVPMIRILEQAGLGPLLLLQHGLPLTVPTTGDLPARARFRLALSSGATSETPISEYDRI